MAHTARTQRPKVRLGVPLPFAMRCPFNRTLHIHCRGPIIIAASQPLREQAAEGVIVYGINYKHTFPNGKKKNLDLAIGTARNVEPPIAGTDLIAAGDMKRVLIACEAKTVMTEHGKSQPRLFDELASSHEIVHQGDREAIAAGITVVNIAATFVSPLRQKGGELHISKHRQPHSAQRMINHLRGLPIRESLDQAGFDAFAQIVVDCDNQGPASLWTDTPAPQLGERDHYDTFISRMADAFATRFGAPPG
jgi:hypothetical protein